MGRNFLNVGLGIVVCSVNIVLAAFSDDFSDPASSSLKWVTSGDAVTKQFTGNACTITNTDATYAGIAYHTFPSNQKKSTFTLSAKITLGQGALSAGIVCCLSLDTKVKGYNVSFTDEGVVVIAKLGSSSADPVLVDMQSGFLKPGTNEIKLTKKEGVFKLYCNGHATATFTDTEFPSGDIGLMVDTKSTVVFDDVVMTDTVEDVVEVTCFADNFDDGDLFGWSRFGNATAGVAVVDNALRITVGSGGGVYQETVLGLKQFVMKTVVSFRGGNTSKMYGLFIRGEGQAPIPLAGFAISGGRFFGAFKGGSPYTPVASPSVKGEFYVSTSGDTTFYKDTLQVIKRDGSAEYLFVVNADTLARLTDVTFPVTGVGIFCSDSLSVVFDDFVAAEGADGTCPVKAPLNNRTFAAKQAFWGSTNDVRFFDLSGRMVARSGGYDKSIQMPGMYVANQPNMQGSKKITIRRDARTLQP